MVSQKTLIRLDVHELRQARTFYEALLGAPPTRHSEGMTVFAFDSPPLVLTVEERPGSRPRAGQGEPPARDTRARFSYVVSDPHHVGDVAVRLWRAGVRLRIGDHGLLVQDPDGNAWRVRFAPSTRGPTVVAT
jgi:catechol 2,3-dioxygenase-like lactoylglutathione lyase family enzyme